MTLSDLTSLARAVDPRYPTNAAILVLMAGAFFLAPSLTDPTGDAAQVGLAAAIAVFFAWAIARELDPDQELAAFGAVALVVALLLLKSAESLASASLFWLLLAMRVANRSTGRPATLVDSLVLLALAYLTRDWVAQGLTALAFAFDAVLCSPHRRHGAFAALAAVLCVSSVLSQAPDLVASRGTAAFGLLPFAAVIRGTRHLSTRADAGGGLLDPPRVHAGQTLALLAAMASTLQFGSASVLMLAPLWSALWGTSLCRLLSAVVAMNQRAR